MNVNLFEAGERVFHPMYGVGTIEGLTIRRQSDQSVEYYQVRLGDPTASVLSVPVSNAELLGLRPIANGLQTIVTCLRSKAHPLPEDHRQRLTELKTRARAPQANALSLAVRDMINYSQTHKLTAADKGWLSAACERLSAEAAWVDTIEQGEARAAIQQEIDQLPGD